MAQGENSQLLPSGYPHNRRARNEGIRFLIQTLDEKAALLPPDQLGLDTLAVLLQAGLIERSRRSASLYAFAAILIALVAVGISVYFAITNDQTELLRQIRDRLPRA